MCSGEYAYESFRMTRLYVCVMYIPTTSRLCIFSSVSLLFFKLDSRSICCKFHRIQHATLLFLSYFVFSKLTNSKHFAHSFVFFFCLIFFLRFSLSNRRFYSFICLLLVSRSLCWATHFNFSFFQMLFCCYSM